MLDNTKARRLFTAEMNWLWKIAVISFKEYRKQEMMT